MLVNPMSLFTILVSDGANKELLLTFDGGIEKTMILPPDKTPGDLAFDYPILSDTLIIDVKSTYTNIRNGFAAIRIWTSGTVPFPYNLDYFYNLIIYQYF